MLKYTLFLGAALTTIGCESVDSKSDDTAVETTDTGDTADTGDTDGSGLSDPWDVTDELLNQDGCSDLYMHAYNASNTVLFNFVTDEPLVYMTHEAGDAPVEYTYSVPDAIFRNLEVQVGTNLNYLSCNDYLEDTVIDDTYTAVSGTVTLTITPEGEKYDYESLGQAVMTLTDGVFENAAGEQILIRSLTLDEAVGWLPG